MEHPAILYEDKDIIVCDKPAGIPVQTRRFGQPDMESILKNHLASSILYEVIDQSSARGR